jgi:tRNA(Ile)-lysidine synthase
MRGSTVSGIAPVRGIFVRPLLDVAGAELREWLAERGLEWREDPTNLDTRFERNWVRHELMPMLVARRAGVAKALARAGAFARADEDVLDALADEVISRAEVDDVGLLIGDELSVLPTAIASRAIRKSFRALGEEASADATEDVLGLGPRGRMRAGSVLVQRIPEGIAFVRAQGVAPAPVRLDEGRAASRDWAVTVRLGTAADERWTWRTHLPEATDVVIRSRRPGDRVGTAAGTRKVQDVLVDAKVPLPLRDLVPVVTVHDEPIAVVGLTTAPHAGPVVLDVQPFEPTWSRAILWNRAAA